MKALTNKSAPRESQAAAKKTAAKKAPTTSPRATKAKAEAAPVAPQTPDVAPEAAPANTKASRAKKTPTPSPVAKGARDCSKTATVLELLKREGGVTAVVLLAATGWQPHSVRGFISGTVGKKMRLTVVSTKSATGERTYTIAS